MALSERALAKKTGRKFYWTGRPCKRGHRARRYTNSGRCYECHLESQRRFDQSHREERNARRREKYRTDSDFAAKCRAYVRAWYRRQNGSQDQSAEPEPVMSPERRAAWAWLNSQAQRLGVKPDEIAAVMAKGWSITTVEDMSPGLAHTIVRAAHDTRGVRLND